MDDSSMNVCENKASLENILTLEVERGITTLPVSYSVLLQQELELRLPCFQMVLMLLSS